MSWFEDIFRNLSFLLDKIVYTLIDWIYRLFVSLAQVNISQDIVEDFATRIYALLGIFMLFRLAFSLITYLINPDNLKEGKTGGGALIKNVFISILLMALVPTIFEEAFKIQEIILEKDIIGQIILGVPMTNKETQDKDTTGQEMAFTIFSAFFTPEHENCSVPFSGNKVNANCRSVLGDSIADDYQKAYEDKKISELGSIINSKDNDGNYIFHYQSFVSTIAGGFVAWIIMIFCIDVSLRLVKLAFLQIIAPIPIISYIDPKGADGIFKKWYTTCFKTFADVFIRLVAIYFAIYIISLLTSGFFNGDAFFVGYGDQQRALTGIETVFVILGVLMFAKQLPDLLKDLLGIDLKGNFTLNPMKKLADTSPFASAALGMASGAVGGLVGNIMASRQAHTGVGAGIKHALGGVFTGAARGAKAGYDSKGAKLFSSSWNAAGKGGQNILSKEAAKAEGVRGRDKFFASANKAVGLKTASERTDEKLKSLDKVSSSYKAIKDRAKSEFIKGKNVDMASLNRYNSVKNQIEVLKSQSIDRSAFGSDTEAYNKAVREQAERITTMEQALVKAEDACVESYINNVKANKSDAVILTQFAEMQQAMEESDIKFVERDEKGEITKVIDNVDDVDFEHMKGASSDAEMVAATTRSSDTYRRDVAATNYANRNGNSGK